MARRPTPGDTVTPIRTATNTALPPIPVGDEPFDMAVTPNERTLYVLNSGGDTVTPIRVATNTAGAPIPAPHQPFTLAITPNGKTLYVTGGTNLLTPIRTSQPSRDTHRRRGGAQRFRFRRCGMIRPWPATKIWRSGYGSSSSAACSEPALRPIATI